MDELLAWLLEPMHRDRAAGRADDQGPASDEEANAVGRFLYCMAAGEDAPLP